MASNTHNANHYYVPNPSTYPVVLSAGLLALAAGFILSINAFPVGRWMMTGGAAVVLAMIFKWMGSIIAENQKLLVISVLELQLSVAEHRHFKSIRGKRANRPGTEIAQNFSFVAGPASDCDHECRGRYGRSAARQS